MIWELNEFPLQHQGWIVSAICVLCNFIHIYDPTDLIDYIDDEQEEARGEDQVAVTYRNGQISSQEAEAAERDCQSYVETIPRVFG